MNKVQKPAMGSRPRGDCSSKFPQLLQTLDHLYQCCCQIQLGSLPSLGSPMQLVCRSFVFQQWHCETQLSTSGEEALQNERNAQTTIRWWQSREKRKGSWMAANIFARSVEVHPCMHNPICISKVLIVVESARAFSSCLIVSMLEDWWLLDRISSQCPDCVWANLWESAFTGRCMSWLDGGSSFFGGSIAIFSWFWILEVVLTTASAVSRELIWLSFSLTFSLRTLWTWEPLHS